jgi:hypothetical protein
MHNGKVICDHLKFTTTFLKNRLGSAHTIEIVKIHPINIGDN